MHDKTKHILRKELKIRELVESGEVKVEYVESSRTSPTSSFTKPQEVNKNLSLPRAKSRSARRS